MNIEEVSFLFNPIATTVVGALLTGYSMAIAIPANAVTFVTERSALNANDSFDFGSLGGIFDPFAPPTPDSFLSNNFSATSVNGLELDFTVPPTDDPFISPPFIFQTGSDIPTNFADGDFLLFTGADFRAFPAPGNSAPVAIDFATPVFGAGTQIAVDDTFSFNANVSAFDSGGNLLDSFSIPATSSLYLDNSAVFLGIVNEEANISRLVYSSSVDNRAIGLNTISINSIGERTISESTSILGLLFVATCSIFCLAQKQRQVSVQNSKFIK